MTGALSLSRLVSLRDLGSQWLAAWSSALLRRLLRRDRAAVKYESPIEIKLRVGHDNNTEVCGFGVGLCQNRALLVTAHDASDYKLRRPCSSKRWPGMAVSYHR